MDDLTPPTAPFSTLRPRCKWHESGTTVAARFDDSDYVGWGRQRPLTVAEIPARMPPTFVPEFLRTAARGTGLRSHVTSNILVMLSGLILPVADSLGGPGRGHREGAV